MTRCIQPNGLYAYCTGLGLFWRLTTGEQKWPVFDGFSDLSLQPGEAVDQFPELLPDFRQSGVLSGDKIIQRPTSILREGQQQLDGGLLQPALQLGEVVSGDVVQLRKFLLGHAHLLAQNADSDSRFLRVKIHNKFLRVVTF